MKLFELLCKKDDPMKVIRVLAAIAYIVAIILLFLAYIFENHLLSVVGSCIGLLCTLLFSFWTRSAKKNNNTDSTPDTKN